MNDHAANLKAFLDARCAALSSRQRPLSWSAWLASAAVIAGCGGRTEPFQAAGADGAIAEDCENQLDDDGDGTVDCDDLDCASSAACGARYGIPYDGD